MTRLGNLCKNFFGKTISASTFRENSMSIAFLERIPEKDAIEVSLLQSCATRKKNENM